VNFRTWKQIEYVTAVASIFFILFFRLLPSACVATHRIFTHARRLHLLKAIHYDSKIISFDSSRQWRGRHPIKSYVAAPETTEYDEPPCTFLSYKPPVLSLYIVIPVTLFFSSIPSRFVATFPEAVQSEELYLVEHPRLRGNRQREKKLLFHANRNI